MTARPTRDQRLAETASGETEHSVAASGDRADRQSTGAGRSSGGLDQGLPFEERVRRVVDRAPPLTADQLAQIRDLLPPVRRREAGRADAA